jgi:hypothetical protein
MMQTQFMQQMSQTIQNLQQNPPTHVLVRSKRREFLKGRPPIFTYSPNPLHAKDWLRAVEKQLEIAQCDDKEKVFYGSGQL